MGEERGGQAFVDLWEREVGPLEPAEQSRMRGYDFTAMRLAAQDREGLEGVLPTIHVPCLLFAGAKDEAHAWAEKAAGQIRNARFVSIPGLAHGETMRHPDLVVPIVRGFLREVDA